MNQLGANRSNINRIIKGGKPVILTDRGVPVAIIEPLTPASKDQTNLIYELIESGRLQPNQRSGDVREWKYRNARQNAA